MTVMFNEQELDVFIKKVHAAKHGSDFILGLRIGAEITIRQAGLSGVQGTDELINLMTRNSLRTIGTVIEGTDATLEDFLAYVDKRGSEHVNKFFTDNFDIEEVYHVN